MIELFTEHPATVGETYWQHLSFAARSGSAMVLAGGACLVHALLPFLFVTTASRTMRTLSERMERRLYRAGASVRRAVGAARSDARP
jgi:hypothetical protein